MTAQSFCKWVNNHLLPSSHLPLLYPCIISLRTAIRWLHYLGFKPVSHNKIDGHEREDVVKHREKYLKTTDSLANPTSLHLCVRMNHQEFIKRKMRIRSSLCYYIMMSQSTTPMRDRFGCGGGGGGMKDQHFCQNQRQRFMKQVKDACDIAAEKYSATEQESNFFKILNF